MAATAHGASGRQSCQSCHSLIVVAVAREDAEGWEEIVAADEAIGAKVPKGERKALVAYLEANFGEDTPPMKGSGDPAEGPFGPR